MTQNKQALDTHTEARAIARQILNRAQRLPIQILIRIKRGLLVRYTNNGVHQNGFQDLVFYHLYARGPHGTFSVESNDCSDAGIDRALNDLRAFVPHPQRRQKVHRQKYPKVKEHFSLNLEKIPHTAARAIEEGLDLIRSQRASANGYYSAYERAFYFADSSGLELFHPATAVRFGVTVTKGAGKGYFSFYHPDPKRLDVSSVVNRAIEWAHEGSSNEFFLEPGEYECILSPRAFFEVMEPLLPHFDRSLYQKQKSLLSRFLGKRIFSKVFTLHDDITDPKQFGVPFDVEGIPRRKTVLVENGILKNFLGEGASTVGIREQSIYPQNLVVANGSVSVAELFRGVRKGIFINKVRYHTLVREQDLQVTGLATAGCLYIEDGRILGRVGFLRYQDSIFSMLRSLVAVSKERILLKDGELGAALLPYFLISKLRVV